MLEVFQVLSLMIAFATLMVLVSKKDYTTKNTIHSLARLMVDFVNFIILPQWG